MQNKRLESLDAFRGFDMMFIVGLSSIIVAICNLFPGGADCAIVRQMDHALWDGLTFMDTVFPTFLFISGISFPFSYAKSKSLGLNKKLIYLKNLKRALLLFIFGLLYNGLLNHFDLSTMRFYSVLGRIGFAWFFASILYMNCSRKAREIICGIILIAYFCLLKFIVAPDAPAGADTLSLEGNIAGWIDRKINIGSMYLGIFDPEGLLGLLPATVTAMLGMLTGEHVRSGRGKGKCLPMILTAVGMLVAGLIWSIWFPINKNLWTSSFTLVVGAYSLAAFTLFYWIIDIKGHKKWILPFKVIGMNSITVYLATAFVDFGFTTKRILGGTMALAGGAWGELIYSLGYFALILGSMYFLYKKKVFLKV